MKKFLTFVSLAMILFAGITAALQLAAMPRTYEGQNATGHGSGGRAAAESGSL